MRELAAQFLALAEKQGATVPLMIGHRLMGSSLLFTGEIAEGRAHSISAIALYDPAEHRPLATRFGQDIGVAILSYRSLGPMVAWLSRGRARGRGARARGCARDRPSRHVDVCAGHTHRSTQIYCGNYAAANAQADELVALADEKGALYLEGARNVDIKVAYLR